MYQRELEKKIEINTFTISFVFCNLWDILCIIFVRHVLLEALCAIWCHLQKLKNVTNTHQGVLLLVKLQTSACIFTKSNSLPWVFFEPFKQCQWYQITDSITFTFYSSFIYFLGFLSLTLQAYSFGQKSPSKILRNHISFHVNEFGKNAFEQSHFLQLDIN